MTFDEYQRRPVYVVQVFTAWVFRVTQAAGWPRLRILPRYRDAADCERRKRVADTVPVLRRAGLDRPTVRAVHESIISDPRGIATRVDIERELELYERQGNT